jgi:hypothetical protein
MDPSQHKYWVYVVKKKKTKDVMNLNSQGRAFIGRNLNENTKLMLILNWKFFLLLTPFDFYTIYYFYNLHRIKNKDWLTILSSTNNHKIKLQQLLQIINLNKSSKSKTKELVPTLSNPFYLRNLTIPIFQIS